MSGRRAVRPLGVARVPVSRTKDADTNRALTSIAFAVQKVQSDRKRFVVEADLVVGTNKIPHSLGRPCAGYTVTPTEADATFAHAIDKTNPRPDREVWITVVGVAQPGAIVEVF